MVCDIESVDGDDVYAGSTSADPGSTKSTPHASEGKSFPGQAFLKT